MEICTQNLGCVKTGKKIDKHMLEIKTYKIEILTTLKDDMSVIVLALKVCQTIYGKVTLQEQKSNFWL